MKSKKTSETEKQQQEKYLILRLANIFSKTKKSDKEIEEIANSGKLYSDLGSIFEDSEHMKKTIKEFLTFVDFPETKKEDKGRKEKKNK